MDRCLGSTKTALNRQQGTEKNKPLYSIQWADQRLEHVYNYACPEKSEGELTGEPLFEWIEANSRDWRRMPHGTAAVFPITSSKEGLYQDGSAVDDSEITLYHASRPALLKQILQQGLAPSIHSHGICGLWVFALAPWAAYCWGSCILENVEGMILGITIARKMLRERSARPCHQQKHPWDRSWGLSEVCGGRAVFKLCLANQADHCGLSSSGSQRLPFLPGPLLRSTTFCAVGTWAVRVPRRKPGASFGTRASANAEESLA